jgi:MFS family permease
MSKAENEGPVAVTDEPPSIEEQLEAIGTGRFNYVVLLVLALFNLAYGMEILVSNICYRAMPRTAWGMTDQDRANLVSISYVGFICGAMISGFYADSYGRKPLILLHSLLFIPFALWSALAPDLFTVYVTRAVVGTSIGIMLPVSVSLMAELAPPSQRGWMILAVPSVGFALGQVSVLLVGLVAMRTGDVECEDDCGWWRWVFAAGLFPDAIALILFLSYVPESPRYLLLRGRVADAEEVIRRIAASNSAEARLRCAGRLRPLEPADDRASLWELLTPPLALEMALIASVWTLLGFGHYGLSFLVPVLLETVYHFNAHWQARATATALPSLSPESNLPIRQP